MKMHEIVNESGEPKNPSRRGFLKKTAGLAAQAALPKGALPNVASTVGDLAAKATAAPAAAIMPNALTKLYHALVDYGNDVGGWSSASHDDDYEGDYDDDDYWNTELDDPQGETGSTPWGEGYQYHTTPKGRPYLTSASPGGETMTVVYFKTGHDTPYVIELTWDSVDQSYSELVHTNDPDLTDEDVYNIIELDVGELNDENVDAFVDAVVDRKSETATGSIGPSDELGDITRLAGVAKNPVSKIAQAAGVAKKIWDKARGSEPSAGEKDMGTIKPETPSLPAPTKPDVLEPDLSKLKSGERVRSDKK